MSKKRNSSFTISPLKIDYLVSGFRISVGPDSTTPGPRTHILGFINSLRTGGHDVRLQLMSTTPWLGRFAKIRPSDYSNASPAKVWLADAVRIVASLWAGLYLTVTSTLQDPPAIIYERAGVLQSYTSFHPFKRRAVRIVEANGILSRETVLDRKALKSQRLAAAIERHVFRKAEIIVAVSDNLKTEIASFAGIPLDRILVVPNAATESFFSIKRSATTDSFVLGFVGSLSTWQHLDQFLSVFADNQATWASRLGRNVKLEIIGDGVERQALLSITSAKDIDGVVKFWGAKSHEESLSIMAGWHVGFAGHEKSSSGTMYHSPLKVYEYAALGLSVVCTYSSDSESLREVGVPVYYFSDQKSLGSALWSGLEQVSNQAAPDVKLIRDAVSANHSWDKRTDAVLRLAQSIRSIN